MKNRSNVLYVLRLALTLLIITGAVAAALSGVNAITAEKIAQIREEKTQQAIVQVLPLLQDSEIQTTPVNSGIVKTLYTTEVGYAVEVVPSGFDGGITMMVGIANGEVTGISVISHTETPGLGAVAAAENAKGEEFRQQFVGMFGDLAVTKDGGTIDSITSATITSRAVTEGVNAALAYVKTLG